MSAGFSITITAIDGASARLDAVNKRLAAMRAPAERLQKQLSTFARLSGIQKVGEGFQRMARGALSAFQNIARVVAPLSAITGAASVAGMYRMVEAWGQWGRQLGFAAAQIGIPVQRLNAFEGAATLTGASADAMASSLQGLGQTMYDAIGGRNVEALALFNQLGIAIDNGSRHAITADAAFRKLADAVASTTNPFTQLRIVTRAGVDPSLLPLLRQGSKGVDEYLAKVQKYAPVTAAGIAAAKQFADAQAALGLSLQGLGNAISERLAPVIAPLLTQLADWIVRARTSQFVTHDLGEAAKRLGAYLSQIDFKAFVADLRDTWHTADGIAQAFGGWKRVLEGIVAIKLAGWAASAIAPFTTVLRLMALIPGSGVTGGMLALAGISVAAQTKSRNASINFDRRRGLTADQAAGNYVTGQTGVNLPDVPSYGPADGGLGGRFYRWITGTQTSVSQGDTSAAMRAFQAMGYKPAQAAGIVAGLDDESGLNPTAVGDHGAAYGIGQWHKDRQDYFARLFGHDIRKSTLAEQMQFVNEELHSTESGAMHRLQDASTPYDAGFAFRRGYERPANPNDAVLSGNHAAQLADAQAGKPGATGTVNLKIEIADKGNNVEKMTARATGNVNPPKIATTMVGADSGV